MAGESTDPGDRIRFTRRDAERISEAVRFAQAFDRGHYNPSPPPIGAPALQAAPLWIVKVTDQPATATPGLYVGVCRQLQVYFSQSPPAAPVWEDAPDQEPCRIVHPSGGTFADGDTGLGMIVGEYRVNNDPANPPIPIFAVGTIGSAAPESFLAQLTAKCYYDGSDTRDTDGFTPTGPGLNCPPNLLCLNRWIAYSWVKVVENRGETDDCPLQFVEADPPLSGSPQCFPAYHEGDADLPVFPPASPRTNPPNTATGDTGSGNVVWTNPASAIGADDTWATCVLAAAQSTKRLILTGFCFGLAGNATIDSIQVDVEAHADGSGVPDLEVALVVNGSVLATSLHTGADLPTTDAVRSYSGTPTTWGDATLKVREVNAADFGVSLRYNNTSGAARTVSVDAVTIAVSFSPNGFTSPRHAVVRLRKGAGNWYLIDQLPWIDFIRRTGISDAYGEIAFHYYFDQNTGTYKDGREVRLVTPP